MRLYMISNFIYVHILICRFTDGEVMVFGGNNKYHFCREYTISLLPVIPIYGSQFADDIMVTPPEDGP